MAGSCPDRSSSSAASPGSASRRSCSRPRPASCAAPDPDVRVLYATGEESAAQVRLRAGRLGLLDGPAAARVSILAEHDIGWIVEAATSASPIVLIVDSVQTATTDDLDGPAGSVGQVRASTVQLMDYAKGEGVAVILAGHVTKDGSIAGPEDARAPRRCGRQPRRRAVRGAAAPAGLEEPIRVDRGGRRLRDGRGAVSSRSPIPPGPSSWTTSCRPPGSVVAPTMEGSRPLLVEVQALVSPASYGNAGPSRERARPEPPDPVDRRPRPTRGDRPRVSTTSTRTSPAAWRSASPASTCRWPSPSPRRCGIGPIAAGHGRDRRGRDCSASCARVSGLERRLREAARLGFEPGDRAACRTRPADARRPRRPDRRCRHAPGRRSSELSPNPPGVAMPCRRC